MRLKEYKPKYKNIELLELVMGGRFFTIVGIMSINEAKKEYGDKFVISVRDFHKTKSTSIIVGDEPLDNEA